MTGILEKVNSPEDLKALTYPELNTLAQELRDEIVKTISLNGGHLASSLGAVELTIAIHRIFQSPQDKIIWDVGHQSYAHKLLTGRKDRFSTIRQFGGLSGFPCRQESPHDAFTTGHAGTSVSAAMGMAMARDLKKEKYQVVSVIGDGSLGTGIAFEAINHAGHQGTKLIVILNDNGMAISPTLGAMSRLLNQVRIDSRLETAKNQVKRAFGHLPLGDSALKISKRAKKGLERVILPHAFWEQMGFIYLGPLDGHNIREMEAALTRARDYESRPVIVHVLTVKGKGYAAAEDNAVKFHGISPNVTLKENGHSSYSQVFGQTIQRLMRENDKIIAISAAMLDGTGLAQVAQEFPSRVIDVGICEQHAVTLAAGLATQGFIPVVAVYSTFLQRAYDQIIHDVCLQNLPVVFAIDRAGIVGEDGPTHQGAFDISYLTSAPNMIVSSPKDEDELQHLVFTAIQAGQPIAVRFPRGQGEGVTLNTELQLLPIGKGEVLRDGTDLAILAIGSTVYPALKAAEEMANDGIECTVVNARFAKPLDANLILEVAQKTRRLITIEENALTGGFGNAVLQLLAASNLNQVKVECIGLPDRFIEHGNPDLFRAKFDLDSAGIIRRLKKAFPELAVKKALLQLNKVKPPTVRQN
jgi:1-deoxy-D-xylulose-5-phosphate synthase